MRVGLGSKGVKGASQCLESTYFGLVESASVCFHN